MNRFSHRFGAVIVVAAVLPLVVDSAATAQTAGRDNVAKAVNRQDGSELVVTSFQTSRLKGDAISPGNTAFAYASCTNCQTLAVAFQVNLVEASPSTVTPTNQAWAYNFGCQSCTTIGDAYQWVVGVTDGASFNPTADRQLRDVRRQLNEMQHSGLSVDELNTQVPELASEVDQAIADGIAQSGTANSRREDPQRETAADTPGAPSPDAAGMSTASDPTDTDAAVTPPAAPDDTAAPTTTAAPQPSTTDTTEPSTTGAQSTTGSTSPAQVTPAA
jgi:putative peptide zinc metalloprotease protein